MTITNKLQHYKVTTLYVAGIIFIYYETVRSTLLGNVCLTPPAGDASGFRGLVNFLSLLKELLCLMCLRIL